MRVQDFPHYDTLDPLASWWKKTEFAPATTAVRRRSLWGCIILKAREGESQASDNSAIMCDSYCCHKSCGKRSREDNDIVLPEIDKTDEGPSLKSSRRPSLDASCSKTASPPVKRLPLARSLKEFLEPGGFMKYLPRPEWYTDSNSLKVQEANTYNTDAHAPFYFQIDENISESDFTFLPITENYPSAKTEMTRPRKSVKAAVFGKDVSRQTTLF